MDMVVFIANRIIKAAEKSIENGRKTYRAYFVNITLYERYRNDVDAILEQDGYEDVIVR